MSTNYLALRSSAAPTLTVSTLLGSTISTRSISFQSTTISLGQSTNQSYTNFSGGSFTTGWASTLTGTTSIKEVVLSPNGSVQTVLQNSGSTMSTVITSANSGSTWAGSTMRGLPTSGALPYQTYGSTTVPSITAITAAPSGTNQLAIASNDLVYASANSGATFAPTGLGQNNNPFIYLPFDGSVADVIGNSVVTATGSPAYVAGKVGTNAVNLANTAGGTATQYLRGTWTGSNSFTVSFWFNAQTLSGYANLFITANATVSVFINAGNNVLTLYIGGTSINGPVISTNTWYNITAVYQNGGTSSLYVNNAFYASGTGSWNPANITVYGIGAQEIFTAQAAFNGYIDDFRIYNYAVTNPSGAALINPLVGPIMPFIYLTFDGSSITTDVMGNSAVTATGSPGFVAGQVGSNAIYFANAGTGSNPTQYLTGTVSGLGNAITFSCWFQALILPSSGAETVWGMNAVTTGAIIVQFSIATTGIVTFQYYNGSSWQAVYSTSAISLNTWYNAVCIYQGAGTFSLYLNGALTTNTGSGVITPAIASYTIGGANTSPVTPTFGFRGYVDDFRIYTGAFTPSQLSPVLSSPSHAIGSPNIYLPFENGSVLDTMGYSAVSARGTMNFVPGVVGTAALNLVNPVSGNPNNYVYASWAGSSSFTVSGWVNVQGFSGYSIIFSAYNRGIQIYTNYGTNTISAVVPSGSSTTYLSFNPSSPAVVNTWYSFTLIFQTNGLCSFYVNNQLVGSGMNSGGFGSFTNSGSICLGGYDTATASGSNAFSGYIDDLKIYNCAVPFHALSPMNYTQAAISNSGAYQVVAAANGGVYTSANSGSTWSQVTLASLQPAAAVNTVGGQVITPNLTDLAAASWTQNGVVWTASASTSFGVLYPYGAFNNYVGSAGTYSWASINNVYSATTPFAYTGAVSTTILGSAITGEWLQIQTSVPLVMQSYSYTCGGFLNIPQKYWIVGSNDGSTWYPIQYVSMTTNPFTANFQVASTYITVNQSGTQTIIGNQTGSGSFTTYSTTTNAYTYFRIIATNVFGTGAVFEFGELYINFVTPATPLYVAPSAALIANQSVNAINVMPQQLGLSSNTWTTNGISWTASTSTTAGGSYPFLAFNNITGGSAFYSGVFYNGNTGAYTGSVSTAISGLSAATGEWLQIQSSAPVVMNSYTFGCTGWWQIHKTGFIVGSTDGMTWFPIQSFTMTTNPFTTIYLTASNYITIGPTGTQTQAVYGNQVGSGSFTGYATSSNAYTYFRFIASTIFGASSNPDASNNDQFSQSEWFINFTAYTPSLLQALTVSPTGQYMALTGAGATAPNSTAAVASTWTTNGVNWTAVASSYVSVLFPYVAFNNFAATTTSPATYSWASTGYAIGVSGYNPSGVYQGSASTTVLLSVGAVTGEWLQIQSSVPLVMSSYTFACGGFRNYPNNYFIVGSTDGTNWYPIQSVATGTNPFTVDFTAASTYLTVNQAGIQTIQGNVAGSATCAVYSTTNNAFTYFRLIASSTFGGPNGNFELTEWYINFQSGPTFYSTDYGSSWTRSLSAATVPNANVLAISGNGQYSLQGYGQTVTVVTNTFVGYSTGTYTTSTFSPALSSTAGPVTNAAVSASGQYMVIVTQGTTNNVYYSSNYGVSFTGITLGSTAMVSCAVSADGSYITVANQTQVFTLNSNAQGFTLALGNSAGAVNQGQNAIAIGDKAGQTNQSANSIILNGSGSAVNAYVPGFFVAPVLPSGSSLSGSFAVLGYGTDSQVVQTNVTITPAGAITLGNSVMPAVTSGTTYGSTALVGQFGSGISSYWGSLACNIIYTNNTGGWTQYTARLQRMVDSSSFAYIDFMPYVGNGYDYNGLAFGTGNTSTGTEFMRIKGNGNVGIGTTNPDAKCHVEGALGVYSTTNDIMGLFSPNYGSYLHIGSWNRQGNTSKDIVMNLYGGYVGIGITNPTTTLHVNSSGAATSSGILSNRYYLATPGDNMDTTSTADNLYGPWYGMGFSALGYPCLAGYSGVQLKSALGTVILTQNGEVGIGTVSPYATLHVQGGTLVTNPTIYNSAVGGWFIIGYWDCTAAQNAGAHLKLRIMGCNGYDNTTDTNQMGGETTIYLNNLNNLNTTTNANVDGFWKHEGGRIPITQVKAVQGGSRYQYYIYANVQTYTQHSITAETTQGTIWTSQMTSTSDPGANSLTVRVLTLSTSAVGATVGIGAVAPGSNFSTAIPNAKLTILGGVPGLENGKSRISIGGDNSHYSAIEAEHIGGGATTLSFMTCLNAGTNSGNPQTRMFIAAGGNVGIGTVSPGAPLTIHGPYVNNGILNCFMLNSIGGVNLLFAVDSRVNSSSGDWGSSGAIVLVARDTSTNRSINTAGTINASGADYAEYMTKDSDFPAQKGDILGVLPSGKLTNQYDDAIHFLLKSTNPCMVGGDVWGTEAIVGEKPKEPEKEATEEEKEAHATALAAWKARLEAERKKVDRMAFAGQVPVNILGATPGNYIIPLRNADGSIGVAAVSQADMSFSQYQRAVGRVISILEDGRANVIVKAV